MRKVPPTLPSDARGIGALRLHEVEAVFRFTVLDVAEDTADLVGRSPYL